MYTLTCDKCNARGYFCGYNDLFELCECSKKELAMWRNTIEEYRALEKPQHVRNIHGEVEVSIDGENWVKVGRV